MKDKVSRYAAKAAVLIAVLLSVGLCSSVARAQADFQGKFTLPYAVQWGDAVLQPGTYLLTFTHDGQELLVIRNAKNLWAVAFEPINIREGHEKGESALLIGTRGDRRIVHSLRIAELGETFVYDPALAHPHVVEEASNTPTIPVQMAKR